MKYIKIIILGGKGNFKTSVTKKKKKWLNDSKEDLVRVTKLSVKYCQETVFRSHWVSFSSFFVYCNCVHLHSFTCVENIKQFVVFKTVDFELKQ